MPAIDRREGFDLVALLVVSVGTIALGWRLNDHLDHKRAIEQLVGMLRRDNADCRRDLAQALLGYLNRRRVRVLKIEPLPDLAPLCRALQDFAGQFNIKTSDPNAFNFQSMALDVKLAGHY